MLYASIHKTEFLAADNLILSSEMSPRKKLIAAITSRSIHPEGLLIPSIIPANVMTFCSLVLHWVVIQMSLAFLAAASVANIFQGSDKQSDQHSAAQILKISVP